MEREEYKKWCLHVRTSSNLTNELFTLDAIEAYEAGGYNDIVNTDSFKKLLEDMRSSCDVNEFSEDSIGERLQEEDFDRQRTLRDIAFHIVGKEMSQQDIDLEWLEEKEEAMGHAFWLSLTIKDECLTEMVDSLDTKAILRASRNMADHEDNLYSWCRKNIREEMSPSDVIGLINIYNDGAYTELRCGADMLAYILLRDRHWDLWIKMLYSLQYFPLQGAMIYGLRSAADVVTVIKKVKERGEWHAPIMLWMLRERLISVATEERLNLSKNQEECLTEPDRRLLESEIAGFESDFSRYVTESFDVLYNTFGPADSLNWYSRKEDHANNKIESIRVADMKALEIIDNMLTERVDVPVVNMGNLPTNTLLYLSEILCSKNADAGLCKEYIAVLCASLYRDKAFLTPQLSERTLCRMRCVYKCLEESGIDGIELTMNYRPKQKSDDEDYYRQLFQSQRADSYWLSMMMLQAESKEEPSILSRLTDFIYSQPCPDQSLNNNYYFLPLYIGEMVSTQVLHGYKDEYEARLIASDFSLIMILRVLTANEGHLSKSNATDLMKRVSDSWDTDVKNLSRFDKGLAEHLQQYIDVIKKGMGDGKEER